MIKKYLFGSNVKMNVNEIRDNYNIRNRGVDKANQNMCYYNYRRKYIELVETDFLFWNRISDIKQLNFISFIKPSNN